MAGIEITAIESELWWGPILCYWYYQKKEVSGGWYHATIIVNALCPFTNKFQVSRDVIVWDGAWYIFKYLYIYIIYKLNKYIYIYSNAICVKFLLWYCLLQPFLDFSWHKWPLLMSHFTSLAFNLDPWAPDKERQFNSLLCKNSMAVHFCANIHLHIQRSPLQAASLLLNQDLLVS